MKALEEINEYFLKKNAPLCFNPYDEKSVIINGEKDFEDIVNSMEDCGAKDVKNCTVFEFYSKIQYLDRKAQKLKV